MARASGPMHMHMQLSSNRTLSLVERVEKSLSRGFMPRKEIPKILDKCKICQSEEHLWRNSPKRDQQGDGPHAAIAVF